MLGLAIGAVSAFGGPAYRALVADIVGCDRVLTTNSLIMASISAGELNGPAIVGILIAQSGVGSVFLMAAIALAVSAALMMRVDHRICRTDFGRPEEWNGVRFQDASNSGSIADHDDSVSRSRHHAVDAGLCPGRFGRWPNGAGRDFERYGGGVPVWSAGC